MATVLQTISNAKVKVRYKEVYASEGINKKIAVVLPAGPYRGLGLDIAVPDMSVTIKADLVALDHVAIYETLDGYALTIRDTGGDIIVDLTALASNTVVIALYADYTLGSITTADYRAYLYADYLVAPEKDELVVLGTVDVPASGAIPAASITPALRTMTWENKALGGLSWQPLLRNPSFEMGETGAIYLHSSPYWQTSMTGTGTFGIGPIDTDANSGDKCLEMVVDGGLMTALVKQYLQVPVVTGQLIKLKMAKKVLIAATAATGTATVTLDFADKDGASLSSVSTTFDIESVDASWEEIEGVLFVPTGVRVLQSVTVDIVGTYPSPGSALRLDDIQLWLEPSASTDWLPGDTRPTAEVATQALLVGDENSYDGNSVLVKYSGNVLRFRRRDADTTPGVQYETTFPGKVTVAGDVWAGGDADVVGGADVGSLTVGSTADVGGLVTAEGGIVAEDPSTNARVVADANGFPTSRVSFVQEQWLDGALPSLWQQTPLFGSPSLLFEMNSTLKVPSAKIDCAVSEGLLLESTYKAYFAADERVYVLEGEILATADVNDIWWGFGDGPSLAAACQFRKSGSDWRAYTKDSSSSTNTPTGVAIGTSVNRLRIEVHGASMSGGARALFYVNGSLVATNTTNLPDIPCTVGMLVTTSALFAGNVAFGPIGYWYNRVLADDVL